jgi:hypothetical protein
MSIPIPIRGRSAVVSGVTEFDIVISRFSAGFCRHSLTVVVVGSLLLLSPFLCRCSSWVLRNVFSWIKYFYDDICRDVISQDSCVGHQENRVEFSSEYSILC